MRLEVEDFGFEGVMRSVRAIGDRAQDMRVPFNWIATDFERIMASNFASEGQYSGPMWRPLTFKWLMHKIDVGKDHGILQYNRDLVRSLTVRHAKGSVRTIRRDEMILGTRIPYARFHTTGTEHMPRRNFMRIPVWDRRRWVKAIEHYIMTGSMT